MNEKEWVNSIIPEIQNRLNKFDPNMRVLEGKKLPYAFEILSYSRSKPERENTIDYETDILISEYLNEEEWKPRIIIEVKLRNISTHAAITYSHKSSTHKNVHPYLRYGILIGNRKHYPLPGKLFRHGANFDFMFSWKAERASEEEFDEFIQILKEEIIASRNLEEIIYQSRSPNRERYTVLHRPLKLK